MPKCTDLKTNSQTVRDLTGLSEKDIEQLIPYFNSELTTWKQDWTDNGIRRHASRRQSETNSTIEPKDMLLFILSYLRGIPKQDEHGRLFGIPQPAASLWIRTLLAVLRNTLLHLRNSKIKEQVDFYNNLTINPIFSALAETEKIIDGVDTDKYGSLFIINTDANPQAPFISINKKQKLVLSVSKIHNKKLIFNVGELFCGAGGFGLGFILANHPLIRYQPVFAIDNDPDSLTTYEGNTTWLAEHAPEVLEHQPSTFLCDVQEFIPALLGKGKSKVDELDLLIGGPPCQGFSTSNKTSKIDRKIANNILVKVFLDKVGEIHPKLFLMENVQGVKWTKPSDDMIVQSSRNGVQEIQKFKTVQEFLRAKARSLGYLVWDDILDAADFGVPQHRLRFFLFGIRQDLLHSDVKHISLDPYLQRCRVAPQVAVEQAIADLPQLENGQAWEGGSYHPPTDNMYINTIRRFLVNGDLFDHYATLHEPYVIERFHAIPEGSNWEAIREQMTTYNQKTLDNTHRNIYRRLRHDLPANTISHYRKSMVIHPQQDRGLSFREACRLQSFPDWFRFKGIRGSQQQQLANAVPPLMAASVAYAIAELFLDETNRKHLAEHSLYRQG